MTCHCGCVQPTKSKQATFLPGHDLKLRVRLEAQTGGLLGLKALVEAATSFLHGDSHQELFLHQLRTIVTCEPPTAPFPARP
jgi:hypothetical protein